MTELRAGIQTAKANRGELARPVERDLSHVPPDVVADLIALLRSPEKINLDAIEVALQTMKLDADALGFAVCEDDANYVRTLLYRDGRVEMLALTLNPGQRSPVHDHGQSTCIVRVVEGLAHEHVYRSRGTTKGERRFIERELKPGIVTRAPGSMTHSLGNDGDTTLVTLHIYAPPLAKR